MNRVVLIPHFGWTVQSDNPAIQRAINKLSDTDGLADGYTINDGHDYFVSVGDDVDSPTGAGVDLLKYEYPAANAPRSQRTPYKRHIYKFEVPYFLALTTSKIAQHIADAIAADLAKLT